ncbi:MAG: hypothetical protein NTZ24_05135, partial [Deltaproteobacteria bacterium]|nr:hypothetical protein [Deltaproteobacteria bacterium]
MTRQQASGNSTIEIKGTNRMFVRVAVNIASDKTFIYAVPDRFEKGIATGKRVLVPLEKRRLPGYILEAAPASSFENPKDIIDIIDTEPLFNEDDLKFYQWVSRYYIYPPGKTLSEILPGGIDFKSNRWITPAKGKTDHGRVDICPFHERIMDIVTDFPDGIPLNRLKHILGKK